MSIDEYKRCKNISLVYAGDTTYQARINKTTNTINCSCEIIASHYVMILAR